MGAKKQKYTKNSATSNDGTIIGYRQMGSGPGIILMHGGIQAAQNLMKLGTALSDEFTVYIPDRRGRGLSGAFGDNYGQQKETEDLDALLKKQALTISSVWPRVPLSYCNHLLHCRVSIKLPSTSRIFTLTSRRWRDLIS